MPRIGKLQSNKLFNRIKAKISKYNLSPNRNRGPRAPTIPLNLPKQNQTKFTVRENITDPQYATRSDVRHATPRNFGPERNEEHPVEPAETVLAPSPKVLHATEMIDKAVTTYLAAIASQYILVPAIVFAYGEYQKGVLAQVEAFPEAKQYADTLFEKKVACIENFFTRQCASLNERNRKIIMDTPVKKTIARVFEPSAASSKMPVKAYADMTPIEKAKSRAGKITDDYFTVQKDNNFDSENSEVKEARLKYETQISELEKILPDVARDSERILNVLRLHAGRGRTPDKLESILRPDWRI